MVTIAQRHKANADPVSDAHILLLAFQEDGDSAVHRAAQNNEDITHNGQTYVGTAIEIHLPNSSEGENTVRLSMSNLSRTVGAAIIRARNRIGCRLILIDYSAPDTAIIDTLDQFVLKNVQGDSVEISAEIGLRAALQEPVPFQRTNRLTFPGVWFVR